MQNESELKKQKVEIIQIKSPHDFWVSVKHTKTTIPYFSSLIDQEENIQVEIDPDKFKNSSLLNDFPIVGYQSPNSRYWYRAKIISAIQTFGGVEYACYLIDRAENRLGPKERFKHISNPILIDEPPIALHCSLYGIKPNEATENYIKIEGVQKIKATQKYDWTQAATSYFENMCKTPNSKLYMIIQTSKESIQQSLYEIYLFLKLKESTQESICLNRLMVDKSFAAIDMQEENLNEKCIIEPKIRIEQNKSVEPQLASNPVDHNYEKATQIEQVDNKKRSNEFVETTTDSLFPQKLTTDEVMKNYFSYLEENYYDEINVLVHNFSKNLTPIKKYDESLFHPIVIDYIKNHGSNQISDFQSYCLASILNHRHLFAITNQTSTSFKTYIYPLVSMILKYKEEFDDVNGNSKKGYKPNNGPLLLIVCTSCKNAQYIYEIINEIIEQINRYKSLVHRSRGIYTNKSILKCLLLQGGGDESQYDVPLASGSDILISATPFVLLRAIGENKTNLEKLKCLVFDDLFNLVEKFPSQIKALMSKYKNLLELDDNQVIAQFIGFSNQWSPNIRAFLNKFFYDPILIGDNKLELSFYGQIHHDIYECLNLSKKCAQIKSFIDSIQITENDLLNIDFVRWTKIKNLVIFVNERDTCNNLVDELIKSNYSNIYHIHEYTHQGQIDKIVDKFNDFNKKPIEEIVHKLLSKKVKNINLILVIQDSMLKRVNINNSKAVIHFDLPNNKESLSGRLWFMRRYFSMPKDAFSDKNYQDENNNQFDSDFKLPNSSTLNDFNNFIFGNHNGNQHNTNNFEFESECQFELNEKREYHQNDLNIDDSMRLSSIMLFDSINESLNNNYISSIFKFLKRIGYEETKLPLQFVKQAKQQLEKKESKNSKLCPLIKAFGKCIETKKCEFRHKPNTNLDKMGLLAENLPIPFEGYIRFKISFVEDTNYFFINILQHQNLCRDLVKVYDRELFNQFDFELQTYYSNPDNIQFADKFKEDQLYAYKDRTAALFKRISIVKCAKRDKIMGYEVIVQAIDYGAKFKIETQDLIILPEKFKKLPPQAVEVFLCNVCPTDRDLNWSTSSRVFIAERLNKNKEYVGKIQMAAGRTLWLDPINTFNHLKHLDMIVMDDCIRLELITKKYAIRNMRHITELRNLFSQNNLPVPKLQDENFSLKLESEELYSSFYGLKEDDELKNINNLISYNYLEKCDVNEVQITSVETPNKFFVQKEYSQDSLISLNSDFEKFLIKIKEIQETKDNKEYDRDENENNKIYLDYVRRMNLIREKFNMKLFHHLKLEKKLLFCFACLKKENWKPFRAQIVNLYQDETDLRMRVFFVDYGDYDIVRLNDIYPIDLKYLNWLPFQAIECTLENIKQMPSNSNSSLASSVFTTNTSDSLSVAKWPEESGDMLWQLTHYEANIYMILDAIVLNELSSDQKVLKPKCYSVCLKRKNYPTYIDISHLMVKSNVARFSLQELEENMFKIKLEGIDETKTIEEEEDEEFKDLLEDKRKLAVAFFRSRSINKQNITIKSLLNKINTHYLSADQEKLLKSGLIEAFSQTIFFVKDKQLKIEKNLLDLLDFLRRALLLKKPEMNKKVFFNSNGYANLINLLSDQNSPIKENIADLEYVFKFLYELTLESNFIQTEIVNSERYLKSFLNLALNYNITSKHLNETIELIANLINKDNQLIYSKRFGEYLKEKIVEKFDMQNNIFLNNLVNSLTKKYEKFNDENEEKLRESDREEKEKLIRCAEYVASNFNEDNTNLNPNSEENIYGDANDIDSSDEEVMEEFTNELMGLMKQIAKMNPKNSQLALLNEDNLPKINDYIHPKLSWDQTKETIIIKVHLKQCKEWKIDYGPNTISFRTNFNEKTYGFDLELYANIFGDKSKAETNANFVLITLKKQFDAIWIRLLSTLNKPKFIKSEYNNLESSSSDEENNEKGKNMDRVPLYHHSSSESDESTDFEDIIYNDVKESKDIYWDD